MVLLWLSSVGEWIGCDSFTAGNVCCTCVSRDSHRITWFTHLSRWRTCEPTWLTHLSRWRSVNSHLVISNARRKWYKSRDFIVGFKISQIGIIWVKYGTFEAFFWTFWICWKIQSQNVLENDLQKSQNFSHFVSIWPTSSPNLPSR